MLAQQHMVQQAALQQAAAAHGMHGAGAGVPGLPPQQLAQLQEQVAMQLQALQAQQAAAQGAMVFHHPATAAANARAAAPWPDAGGPPQWVGADLAARLRDPRRAAVMQELRMVHARVAQLTSYLQAHDHEEARKTAVRRVLKAVATRDGA